MTDEKLNTIGGYDYPKGEQPIAKKVDLITLPESVEGTNCFNCLYIKNDDNKKGFCTHKDIRLNVTKRMCCALWDNKGALRSWEKESKFNDGGNIEDFIYKTGNFTHLTYNIGNL